MISYTTNILRTLIIIVTCTNPLGASPFFSFQKNPFLHKRKALLQEQNERDFDASMDFDSSFKSQKRQKHFLTKTCKELYVRNNPTKVPLSKQTLIPKVVHLIWLGEKTPPPVFQDCLESIKRHLPNWQVRFWTDSDIPSLNLINQKYYDEESNYGAKSDILRYEVLHVFGGLYLDVDMILVKPLDILHHTYEFYTGLQPSSFENILGNAIIGSVPGHPILKKCIENIRHHRKMESILARTGPGLFEKSFSEALPPACDRCIALPASYFYPAAKKLEASENIHYYVKPETYAIHCWAGSWGTKN